MLAYVSSGAAMHSFDIDKTSSNMCLDVPLYISPLLVMISVLRGKTTCIVAVVVRFIFVHKMCMNA